MNIATQNTTQSKAVKPTHINSGKTKSEIVVKTGKPIFLSKRDLASTLAGSAGFFIGRAVVFQMVNPLAVAFLATFMEAGAGWSFYITAVFVTLGLATRISDIFVFRYILAVGLLCLCHYLSNRILYPRFRSQRTRLYIQAVFAGICTLAAGVSVAVIMQGSGYLLAIAILECVLSASLVLIIKRAALILTAHRRKNILSGEDMVSLSVVLGAVIAGASDIHIGELSLRFFLCLYVLFVVSHKGGAAMGGAAGMLLGFMLHLAGFWDTGMAIVLALAGMGGGFVKRAGKGVVIGTVVLTGTAALYILARTQLNFSLIYSAIAAGTAFLFTPQGFHFNVASAVNPGMDTASEYIEKIKEETISRLNAFANAFEKLALTFTGLSKPVKTTLNKNDVSQLIDDLSVRACEGCPRYADCWDDSFYETYRHVFTLLSVCGRNGLASIEDAESGFTENCVNAEAFLQQLNTIFALYKQNLQWHNRIAESRELVSQQLNGVSGIMRQLSAEIDVSLRFHEELEEEMITALLRHKIEVDSVLVLEDKAGRYQVTINHPACPDTYKKSCTQTILPVLNAVLRRNMQVERDDCRVTSSRRGTCTLRFVESRNFRVYSGIAHRAKQSRADSGDSYSYMELKSGQCLLALSDGMGSGAKAKRESAATVDLLEDFLESGFEKELAVKMINSVLVLKSSEESFSTLDICAVDLYTGEAEFIKIGASSTFLLRDGKVSIIGSSSLPIGMLKHVDLETTGRRLQHGDIILMVTDGITEAVEDGDHDDWVANTLRNCKSQNPQEVAEYILRAAENKSGGLPKDDMTVLAARLWRKG